MLQEHRTNGDSLYLYYLYEPDSYAPLACVDRQGDDEHTYYFHIDQIGTPLDVTDEDGKRYGSHLAWGEVKSYATQEIEQNLRFQGQYFDAETGLHYNTFRYYDPVVGRFVGQDPISLLGGLNLYQYAPNAQMWLDPWGWAGNPANATHITYEGIKDGKPYIGYASKPGLGHSAADVLKYRYPNTNHFDVTPTEIYVGNGQEGKNIARGLEQRIFEDRGGLAGTSNKQNPVGLGNQNRAAYLSAADAHLAASSAQGNPLTKGATGC